MKRVNSFVAMNSEAQEISEKKDESSSKKAEIAQDSSERGEGNWFLINDGYSNDVIPLDYQTSSRLLQYSLLEKDNGHYQLIKKLLEADYWIEMCYQLLKCMGKAAKGSLNCLNALPDSDEDF
ncbi:hypothetical protein Tco_1200642 [Tanacetum coccineum]